MYFHMQCTSIMQQIASKQHYGLQLYTLIENRRRGLRGTGQLASTAFADRIKRTNKRKNYVHTIATALAIALFLDSGF